MTDQSALPAGPPLERPGKPIASQSIDEGLVRALLRSQCPIYADLPLVKAASGWDNEMYRLGDELAVRLPRRDIAAPNITNEQRWLPGLAPVLPIRVPVAIVSGTPDFGYPYAWSVVNWAPGTTAASSPLLPANASVVAEFLLALHSQVPPADAPINPWRGGLLAERTEAVEERLEAVFRKDPGLEVRHGDVLSLWMSASRVPIDVPATWIHGDLHPKNLIVDDGLIVMVIDWGDICVGDPATDLAAAWMLFDGPAVEEFRRSYGEVSEATWLRARGWAVYFGAVLLLNGLADDPAFAAVGRRTLNRVGMSR